MKTFAPKQPVIKNTTWKQIFHNHRVTCYSSEQNFDFYRVEAKGQKPKHFFGSNAYTDMQLYAIEQSKFD
jgi:hypothetical protein